MSFQRILVVDDDPVNHDFIRKALPQELVLTGALTAQDARGRLEKQDFDLLLLDLTLPDEDGLKLCSWVRSQERFKELPVMLITGRADIDDKVMAFTLGADDYIVKPFDIREFRARVMAKLKKVREKDGWSRSSTSSPRAARRAPAPEEPVSAWLSAARSSRSTGEGSGRNAIRITGRNSFSSFRSRSSGKSGRPPERARKERGGHVSERQKILIVDDEPRNQRIVVETFEDEYLLRTTDTGERGLELLETFVPDLILLDVMMPGIDGYEVCRRIRSNPRFALTKVVLVSGKAMIEERLKGYEVGADDYMTKPFVPDELKAKVKVFMRLSRAENELSDLNCKAQLETGPRSAGTTGPWARSEFPDLMRLS